MEIFFKNLRKNVRKELKWRNFLKMILIIPGHWVNKCPIFFQQESTYQKKKLKRETKNEMNYVDDVCEETFYDDRSVYNGLEIHVHKTGPTTCF